MTEVTEFRYHTPDAIAGIRRIQSLPDGMVLEAARVDGLARARILVNMGGNLFKGGKTNPSWVSAQCAEEAYRRGLIDERELDRLTD